MLVNIVTNNSKYSMTYYEILCQVNLSSAKSIIAVNRPTHSRTTISCRPHIATGSNKNKLYSSTKHVLVKEGTVERVSETNVLMKGR